MRIAIVVGERSGDKLGAQLVEELKNNYPQLEVEGVIGPELMQQGCTQLFSMDIIAVMGFVEPVLRLPQILKMRKWLINHWTNDPPDIFIGIDAPDFNLGIEKALHNEGILTVHYVSPSVWAWRQGRVHTIRKSVDLMLTIFPFEKKFYEQHKVPAKYIGHPTADKIPLIIDAIPARTKFGYTSEDIVVAVLPGSRSKEIEYMLPIYLQTIALCYAENTRLKFIVPLVSTAYNEVIAAMHAKYAPGVPLQVIDNDSLAVMQAADISLVTSGTATLEVMLHKKPMVVAYKTNFLTYLIARMLVKVKYISLPNLLADRALVPECIQARANPQQLAHELLSLLNSKRLCDNQTAMFTSLHQQLQQGASKQAAAAIVELVGEGEEHVYSGCG